MIEFGPFLVGYEHWRLGAVFTLVKHLLHFVIVWIERDFCLPEQLALALDHIVMVDAWRRRKAREGIERFAVRRFAGEADSSADRRKPDFADKVAIHRECFDFGARILQIAGHKLAAHNANPRQSVL